MELIYYYNSPLGKIKITTDGKFLTGLWFSGQNKYENNLNQSLSKEKSGTLVSFACKEYNENRVDIFKIVLNWLDIYFQGEIPNFTPPLKFQATEFRKTVWEILLKIPYGKMTTYGEIANIIAKEKGILKMSARAVGNAVGHNPILIIIPCHRVIGSFGNLKGYSGGLERKIQLLKTEKININELKDKTRVIS